MRRTKWKKKRPQTIARGNDPSSRLLRLNDDDDDDEPTLIDIRIALIHSSLSLLLPLPGD